jgi:pimeloyl-ACP methyl ester carboxylesterase
MSDNLEPLAAMLDDLVTVHRFDQRGGGRSTGTGEGQTVAGAVADLEALRRRWGHRRWMVGVEPLFAYPRNAEAAAALNRDRARHLADPALERRVRGLEVPTLVLHGAGDPLPAEGAAEIARLLPQARLELLPGMGHTPWLEDAATVRQAVRRFIENIATTAPS